MEKLKQFMKKIMPDQLSAFIILGVYAVTLFLTIGIFTLKRNNTSIQTSGNLNMSEGENVNEYGSIKNLTSVENITDIEELKKLNANEINKAKEKENEEEKEPETPTYYIKVNYGAQVVTIYQKDSEGKYTIPVKAMLCSTGTYTPTSGVYQVPAKYRWCDMIGDVYAQYCTQIVGDILFHSVPYTVKEDHSSLEWWAYDQLGSAVSLGCIRLTCQDAKWIYDNCGIGTQVEFYSSSNPGPLGVPSTPKIGDAPDNIKGWDPTDPAEGNPWESYLKELEKKKKEEEKKKKEEEKKKKEEEKRKQEEAKKQIEVPNVKGLTEEGAREKLKDYDIIVIYDSDSNNEDGIVLEQSIEAGTLVKRGTKITITINKIEVEKPPIENPESPDEEEKEEEPTPEEPDINSVPEPMPDVNELPIENIEEEKINNIENI